MVKSIGKIVIAIVKTCKAAGKHYYNIRQIHDIQVQKMMIEQKKEKATNNINET